MQLGMYLNDTVLMASHWKQQPDGRCCPYPDTLHYIKVISEMKLILFLHDHCYVY